MLSQGTAPTNNNPVFRCEFYLPSYSAFIGKNLVSLGEIELNPTIPSICSSLSDINDLQQGDDKTIVFPNPVSDKLIIKTNSQNFQIQLYNQLGQLLLSKQNESVLDVSHLSLGMYYVKILLEKDNIHSFKIIKE
jgi:hypothetical protein